jgi:hypothetical protein
MTAVDTERKPLRVIHLGTHADLQVGDLYRWVGLYHWLTCAALPDEATRQSPLQIEIARVP